jgi:hypothetical protein
MGRSQPAAADSSPGPPSAGTHRSAGPRELRPFEARLAALENPSDKDVFDVIKDVVLTLNEVNDEYDGAAYETDEREQLCAYIEQSLVEAGIDVDALAARHGLTRHEITDEWRDW